MAFRKKAAAVLKHRPDIVVAPECEHPRKLMFDDETPRPQDMLWIGENENKGLGVFSYSAFRFKLHKSHNPRIKLFAPIVVSGGANNFMLYAVWANNPTDKNGQYITQVWKALHHYKRIIRSTNTILAGDFNSNTIWDRPRREGNHSTVVKHLEAKGICSVYHHYFQQEQGMETHPTHYLYRHRDKPYHLDYCFASADMMSRLKTVEVGDFDSWKAYSDHVPVMASFYS